MNNGKVSKCGIGSYKVRGVYYSHNLDGKFFSDPEIVEKEYIVILQRNCFYCGCSIRKRNNLRFCQHLYASSMFYMLEGGKTDGFDLNKPILHLKELNKSFGVKNTHDLYPTNNPQFIKKENDGISELINANSKKK